MTAGNFVTSTDYGNPYRPLPVKILNLMGRAGENLGLPGALQTGNLSDAARRRTGLAEFGDDGHRRALEVLVKSINDEARLSATGRLIQKSRLTAALVQRLRIQEQLGRHPEIQDIDLGRIILVTGLARTGTTLLQRLLDTNPAIRTVSGMEGLEPVPAGNAREHEATARRRRARLAQQAISYLSPQFATVHPIDHSAPEEDVMLLDLGFMSQTAEATMQVPSYSRWLEDQDHTRNYEYFRKVLQVLCRQRCGNAWALKTPHHMEYLDVFLKVFPEAVVVQTHRDPCRTLPSFCSMVAHARAIFSDHVDLADIAAHWRRKTRRMVELAMQTRARNEPGRFIDVSYYDLVQDPITQLERIYRHAGMDFSGDAVRKAEDYAAANTRGRFGRHAYRLSDFGLDETVIEADFSSYREKYAIPFE